MNHPKDYISVDGRTNLPKAERRTGIDRRLWCDSASGSVLVCLAIFSLLGMAVGALAMWIYLS